LHFQHSKQIEEAETEVDTHLLTAKKLMYIWGVLEKQGKEHVQSGDGDAEKTQASPYHPSEEDIERIPVPDDIEQMKPPDYYKTRMQRAEERIDQEKKRRLNSTRDDYATAVNKYYRAKEVYVGRVKTIKEIHESSKRMKDDMVLRKTRWRQFRDFISDYSGIKFDETRTCQSRSTRYPLLKSLTTPIFDCI
jgi:hypothetical protein